MELEVNQVAHYWGMTPRRFRTLDKEEQAELHATYRVIKEIDYYYSSEQARLIKAAETK